MKRQSFVFSLIFLFLISSLNVGITDAALNNNPIIQTNATDILITFDDVPDFTSLVSAYPGVTFSADWESWYTSSSFPAHSDPAVAYSYDFSNYINFNTVSYVSVYVSSTVSADPITLEAYDDLGILVTSTIIPAYANVSKAELWSGNADIVSIHFEYTAATNGQWVIDDLFLSNSIPLENNLITFEEVPDSTNLNNVYAGVTFSADWSSWVTSAPFTASSAPNVAYSYDFVNFIQFDQAAKFVSVYITNVEVLPIFLEGYDSLGNLVSNATIPGNVEAYYVSIASDLANIDYIHFNYQASSDGFWIIDDFYWSTNLISTLFNEWITFDSVADFTNLKNAYSGVTFSNDWQSWYTSAPYTEHSSPAVAFSYDFNNNIQFDQAAKFVSVYVTNVGSQSIQVHAYDSTGGTVAVANIPANVETYLVYLSAAGDDILSIHFEYPIANDGQWIIDDLSWGADLPLYDAISPTFESFPIDNSYEEGSIGNVIGWTLRDENPSSYNLKRNGLIIESGLWADGDTITTSLDGLSAGVYIFELSVDDVSGNSDVHSVVITVIDTIIPIFTSTPIDMTIFEGDVGNVLQWVATDLHPNNYEVLRDGVRIETGLWVSSGVISISLDGLSAGIYNYTLVVYDEAGHPAASQAMITNKASLSTTTTVTSSETTKLSETTPSEITKSSENGSDTSSSDAPELPIPFSNIYVIMFSMLGFAFIVRKRK